MSELITTYHQQLTNLFRNLDLTKINWSHHPEFLAQLKPVHDYMVTGKVDLDNKFPFTTLIGDIVLSPEPVAAMADFLYCTRVLTDDGHRKLQSSQYGQTVLSKTVDLEAVAADYKTIINAFSEHENHQTQITEKLWCRLNAIANVLFVNNQHVWATGMVYDNDFMRLRELLVQKTHLKDMTIQDRALLLDLASSDDPVLETGLPGLTGHIIQEQREKLEATKTTPVCTSTLKRFGLYSKYLDGHLF